MDADLRKNLIALQNKTKRDPESYRDEFVEQMRHFDAHLDKLNERANEYSPLFVVLLQFISQVASCYPKESAKLPSVLRDLLQSKKENLHKDTRREVVKSLILMQNRGFISSNDNFPILFATLKSNDKRLRKLVLSHIISDVKRISKQKRDHQLHKQIQGIFQAIIGQDDASGSRYAVLLMIELYRRQIWKDNHIVNIIARGCLSRHMRIVMPCIRFLLGKYPKLKLHDDGTKPTEDAEDDDDLIEDEEGSKAVQHRAIQVLDDPYTLVQKVFDRLKSTTEKFDARVCMMGLIARLMSSHFLSFPKFYSYMERYMEPGVQKITQLLAIAAESIHEEVNVDDCRPLMQTVANHFITDKVSPDSIIVGIHTITKMCIRNKELMTPVLLKDLVQYRGKKREKGIVMAARRLLRFYRQEKPDMLDRKDRGKPGRNTPGAVPESDAPDADEDELSGPENDGGEEEFGSDVGDILEDDEDDVLEDGEEGDDAGEAEGEVIEGGAEGAEGDDDGDSAPELIEVEGSAEEGEEEEGEEGEEGEEKDGEEDVVLTRKRPAPINPEDLLEGTTPFKRARLEEKQEMVRERRDASKWSKKKLMKGGGTSHSQKRNAKHMQLIRHKRGIKEKKTRASAVQRSIDKTNRKKDQKFKVRRGW